MAVKHTAVSYYGLNYVEHAQKDFAEVLEHGCDTVILANLYPLPTLRYRP